MEVRSIELPTRRLRLARTEWAVSGPALQPKLGDAVRGPGPAAEPGDRRQHGLRGLHCLAESTGPVRSRGNGLAQVLVFLGSGWLGAAVPGPVLLPDALSISTSCSPVLPWIKK